MPTGGQRGYSHLITTKAKEKPFASSSRLEKVKWPHWCTDWETLYLSRVDDKNSELLRTKVERIVRESYLTLSSIGMCTFTLSAFYEQMLLPRAPFLMNTKMKKERKSGDHLTCLLFT